MDSELKDMITRNPKVIEMMGYQSHEACMYAISLDPNAIVCVKCPTMDMFDFIIARDPTFINNLSDNMIGILLTKNQNLIHYVKNRKFVYQVLCINPYNIALISNPNDDEIAYAVDKNPLVLSYIKKQSDKLCIAAVSKCGNALEYVIKQTKEICIAAVQQNGWSIRYVKSYLLCDEIYIEALLESPESVLYIENPPDYVIIAALGMKPELIVNWQNDAMLVELAVNKSPSVLKLIKKQTPNMCLSAVLASGMSLKYVKDKTFSLCMTACIKDHDALKYVPDEIKAAHASVFKNFIPKN
jgi:hypothetical protein